MKYLISSPPPHICPPDFKADLGRKKENVSSQKVPTCVHICWDSVFLTQKVFFSPYVYLDMVGEPKFVSNEFLLKIYEGFFTQQILHQIFWLRQIFFWLY